MAFYDVVARYFDISLGLKRDYVRESEFVDQIFSNYGGISKVLDIGCGTGNHAIELGKRGYKVIGIDKSREMIRVAKKKLEDRKVDVEFKVMDMLKMRFKERFDGAILMFSSLLHVGSLGNIKKVVKRLADIVRYNGIIIVDVPNFNYKRKYYGYRHINVESELHQESFELLVVSRTTFNRKYYCKDYNFFVRENGKIREIKGGFKEFIASKEQLEEIFEANNLVIENVYGNFNFEKCDEEHPRIIFVLRNNNVGKY